MRYLAFGIPVLAVIALTACGGGGSPVAPTPGPTCGPVGITSQLIYPAPGSTAVPDAQQQIVIVVSSPLPINTYNLALINPPNTQPFSYTRNPLAQIQASQLPAGSGSTTIVNPTYEAVNLTASLPPVMQIQTAINDPNSNCTPQNVPGTFSTQ